MTVEASLVIPMAVGVIVVLIYVAFYLYGMCLLTQDMYILGLRGVRPDTGSPYDSAAEYVVDHAEDRIGNKYFGNERPEITAEDQDDTVVVRGGMETRHGVMGRYFILPGDGGTSIWQQELSVELELERQVEHIRLIKRTADMINGR